MTEISNLDSMIQGRVDPFIYAFETNTVPNFLKVGDTYRPLSVRIDEWRKLYSDLKKIYEHIAKVDDKTYFRDYSVHDFLIHNGFRRIEKDDVKEDVYLSNEFFLNAKKENVDDAIYDIQDSFEKKDNRYAFYDIEENLPLGDFDFSRDTDWKPRKNQQDVIDAFSAAVNKGRTNLLMFAVMRFGKSFTSLCCAKAMKAKLVVVVCGKTAVRLEWKENVQRPKILEEYCFVDSEAMKRNPKIVSEKLAEDYSVVVFLTMQDLLGSDIKTRHEDLFMLNDKGRLDLLIIDETHFGARAEEFGKVLGTNNGKSISKQEKKGYDDSVDELEAQIKIFKPRIKLHLSGTPYRILLDNEFTSDDIIGTVQYSDIIDAKENWDKENIEKDEWENPYYGFPQMIRFAFNLNESAKAKLQDLKNNGYAYDLDELLSPVSTSKDDANHNQFKYKNEVLDLLKAIDGSKDDENIFSFLNYDKIKKGNMCRHIVMVLPYRASCDAMELLLKNEKFNNLNDYEIINIAGFDCPREYNKQDYASRVKAQIEKYESEGKKTISLTVGKMLTGCTVKEWDTMIFLRNTASPQDYDQAIFRLQSQYVKTIKNGKDGKIIKHDMKPQTILVDFDPVRIYTLQHKKSLIANINKSERGNENLEEKLKRELEIAPIVYMNHSKLQKVEAKDIVDSIRNYNASKSMMDETFDIEVDERIFDDDEIKAIIQKQPEITAKGIKFELSPYSSDDESESDIETPDVSENHAETDSAQEEKKDDKQIDDDENKKLICRLQGYYFKLLLFAFLSEKNEKTISDIIRHIKDDEDGKRIGKNLQINVEELSLVRDKINPSILSYLEDKIQNINQLGSEITPDKIGIALRKMSRLSVSEIVTPDKLAKELVDNLPAEITAKSRFLDIASKTGEFATALLQKYGDKAKNSIYSIPTSSVTYECTRKIYKLLGMPVENIYSTFTSYDLIDTNKNEKLLEELKNMNFDVIVGNPPYQIMATGDANGSDPIYHLFIDAACALGEKVSFIHPARFLFNAGKTPKDWNEKMLNDEHYKVVQYWANSADVFTETKKDGDIAIHGLIKNKRVIRFINRKYIEDSENLEKYKVLVPKANGSGAIGEVLSTPLVGQPLVGYSGSFIGIGSFNTKGEAENCMKYIKTKFTRAMLGTLKVTQDNPRETWQNVPLQDFTATSDIDWSKSIGDIDKQLYAKYNLSPKEIDFIEKNVRAME